MSINVVLDLSPRLDRGLVQVLERGEVYGIDCARNMESLIEHIAGIAPAGDLIVHYDPRLFGTAIEEALAPRGIRFNHLRERRGVKL